MTNTPLFDVLAETWPAAATRQMGPFTIRDGKGGGKRVSAATVTGPVSAADLPAAEEAMRGLGQVPLFMIRPGDEALDALLEGEGYSVVDPTRIYAAPCAAVAEQPGPGGDVSTLEVWEPLAFMLELWREGGIGPDRIAVMERVAGPKTGLIGRIVNGPGGTAFVAMHGDTAMLHALEVRSDKRRSGMGRRATIDAARWGLRNGATRFALACTEANAAANGLYSSLGMTVETGYHYRQKV